MIVICYVIVVACKLAPDLPLQGRRKTPRLSLLDNAHAQEIELEICRWFDRLQRKLEGAYA